MCLAARATAICEPTYGLLFVLCQYKCLLASQEQSFPHGKKTAQSESSNSSKVYRLCVAYSMHTKILTTCREGTAKQKWKTIIYSLYQIIMSKSHVMLILNLMQLKWYSYSSHQHRPVRNLESSSSSIGNVLVQMVTMHPC